MASSAIRKRKRPRGRPPKKQAQPPQKKVVTADKTPKTVFEISDDDEVVAVSACDRFDKEDLEARLAAQRARSVLAESTRDNTDLEEAMRAEEEARIERENALKRKQDAERQAEENRRRENTKGQGIIFKARHGTHVKKVRMRTTAPLLRLLPKFCSDYGLDQNKVYVEFDGEEVGPKDTPESIELEQDMIVDVFLRGSRK
ncbi:Ubiquitin-like protein [Gracilaria domingensis]|nr:Ubiquitin-like protein [Gracilaria domingensis]